jgi:acyl transferase domain-containing protein/NADPH:quinone reductase-like Zn-dependent oxidoreductase/NAD(P)-dependent dehydrogenase (short-subunit alcohol dehydrogenase family)/acyl carrier protein
VAPTAIDPTERFQRLGLDSMAATGMLSKLGAALGRPLLPTLAWEYPTPEDLARYLAGGEVALQAMTARSLMSRTDDEPIAIVGMACRFPSAPNPTAFWEMLCEGTDAITEVPAARWEIKSHYDSDPTAPGKMNTRWGGFLPEVDTFDADFFGISPREAAQIDPQQRLALELSWEALEDAGIAPSSLKDTRTGVFFGAMWMDYARLAGGALKQIGQHTVTGTDLSIVAGRVSYTLGLLGPSMAINTACSSSLVAVHLACQSLLRGESSVVLAGGFNLLLSPESTIAMSKFGAMAPDGRSKAFDARANGYVRGEGGGVVALKRLSKAVSDGDRIYCVIRGSAVNNDGFSNGLTAPSPRAQEWVLRDAYAAAGIEPGQAQYVEAHGTGTMLGDPIEAGALGAALGMGRSTERALRIGSVKTNIGHLEAAAGIAGLIKVCLSMHHRMLPPSIHFETPNPHIAFEALGLRVQAAMEPWEGDKGRLVAGVSSFGFGGTNSHIVLESTRSEESRLFVLSAESEDELRAKARSTVGSLQVVGGAGLVAVCEEAARAPCAPWRLSVVARSSDELSCQLIAYADRAQLSGLVVGCARSERSPRVAFVFGGQGSQWRGMGRALLIDEPVARAVLEQCDRAFRRYVTWSLLERLLDATADSFEQTDFVQPAIFALQLALVAVWRARGLEPALVVGQSMGEVAAACTAGALSLDDAARVICERSRLVLQAVGKGGMAVVGLTLQDTSDALAPFDGKLSVAVSSGPELTVVAGEPSALQVFSEELRARGVFCQFVRADYASHSPSMDPLLPELQRVLADIVPRNGEVPFYSTVTAAPLDGVELNAAYWVRNLRAPVLFAPTVRRLLDEGIDIFVEVDPHPVLAQAIEQCIRHAGGPGTVVVSAKRDERESTTLLEAMGKLVVAGAPLPASPVPAERSKPASASLFVLSAKSGKALNAYAAQLAADLDAHPDAELGDVALSLATTRNAMEHRLAIVASSREGLQAALVAAAQGQTPAGVQRGRASPGGAPMVVFVFPGQGSQWLGMGRQLLLEEPIFRASLEASDRAIQAEMGWSLLAELVADETASRLDRVDVVQPVLFALEVALSALWRSWGVTPDAVVGHSMGEVAAAHVAGALSLEHAAAIICRRSRLLCRIRGQGAMAVVELSVPEAEAALAGYEDCLSVAASNSPRSTVLSGEPAALGAVLATLESKGVFCRRVKVDVASHSPQVEPLREELVAALGAIELNATSVAMHSTVTGATIAGPELGANYWAANLRQPVRFADAVQALLKSGHRLFVEMSPHPILTTSVQEVVQAAQQEGAAVGSLRRGQEERPAMLEALGALWVRGHAVAWKRLFPASGRRVPLPTYPWQRERYWIETPASAAASDGRRVHAGDHPLLGEAHVLSTHTSTRLWETTLDRMRLPWLDDHRVQGAVVLPGAAFVEMGLAAGAEAFGGGPFLITDVVFLEALAFSGDAAVPVQVVTTEEQPGRLRLQVASLNPGGDRASWRVHARGMLRRAENVEAPARVDLAALRARLGESGSAATTYESLTEMGLEYGPAFQGITELWRGDGEALGRVKLSAAAGTASAYRLHPALLDACFQVMCGVVMGSGDTMPWVPVALGSLCLFQRPSGELWCHARRVSAGHQLPDRQGADLRVVDSTGAVVAEISGLVMQRLASRARRRDEDDWLLELAWELAAVPAPKVTTGRWLLLDGGDGLGAALRSALKAAGHTVVEAVGRELSVAGLRGLVVDAFGGHEPTAVVHLGSLSSGGGELNEASVEAALVSGCDSVLTTVQALSRMGFRDAPRLWLLSRGAQAVGVGDISVAQAPLLGLGRVIALEHAELRCCRLDLDPTQPIGEVDAVLRELLADDAEEEVALRGDGRRVARLDRPPVVARCEKLESAGDRPFRLEIDEPGVLDRLVLRATERRAPGAGEVEIAIEAAGLNFHDVLLALGAIPNDLPGEPNTPLGGECAGRIVAVGKGVIGLVVGQAVIALAGRTFASHITTPATLVLPRPLGLSVTQAAALPVAYLTAWYALERVACLRPGERVLIHAATGGVGLAAVQWAQHVGAEIYATAGSPEKRAYLESLGVRYVSDSRSTRFVADVQAWTGGEGVDVVLNSLSGELIEKSFGLLRSHGRFVELGKRDYYADNPLGLRPFLRSLSFSLVDLEGMIHWRPTWVRGLFEELLRLVAEGTFTPPVIKTLSIGDAVQAFHMMAQARHIGKLVLTMDADVKVHVATESGVALRADSTYLVTGGLGGLGLSAAGWLVKRGAGHLVLVGRSGAVSVEQQAAVAALEALGARVTVARADVAVRAQVARVLDEIAASGMPLRGVIHAAGRLDDGLLLQQTSAQFRKVMAPKVQGALHLHTLTREMPLDFFVLYSSAAGLLGSPGQGNYAAANTFLDALAHHRREQGLPALSVDWGAFSEVGLAAAQENRGARLVSRGMRSLTPDEGLSALERLLEGDRSQVGVVPLNVRQWVEFYPAASSRMLSRLMVAQHAGASRPAGDQDLIARLAATEPGPRRAALLQAALLEQVAQVLRISKDRLDVDAPLTSLGMDSLMGLELRNRIETTLGTTVPATLLWTYTTVAALSAHLAAETALPLEGEVPEVAAESELGTDAEDVKRMGTDELMNFLDGVFERANKGATR